MPLGRLGRASAAAAIPEIPPHENAVFQNPAKPAPDEDAN